jgi:hypothetical protein
MKWGWVRDRVRRRQLAERVAVQHADTAATEGAARMAVSISERNRHDLVMFPWPAAVMGKLGDI